MKKILIFELSMYSLFALLGFTVPSEKPGEWTSLFDGKTIKGWHSYHKTGVVGWYVEDGAMTPDGTGGDLVTDNEYENFELEFEFKIPKGSNSGVIYKVTDSPDIATTYMSGPEYQVIDDRGYEWKDKDGKLIKLDDKQLTGAAYDVVPPSNKDLTKPAGEWNKGRIVVSNNHVEHYLNGEKVVEYDYGSPDWKERVAKSKFAKWPYATPHAKGKIALQNHSPKERVWYRNVKIREL
ncbi:3-keto-disaccharide hydrolase [Spirosoma montaniterrae]|uniref:3-keto-alpha-glucoside-1,2-lyase/3-keto-2-hydroxy-glucal hydratase domain-containing protein n=1 Tax=Spirosoma montaniterrae TaxID=1178516 RepID=A0A1P9X087_9BACT|nr:DUF1080 domain-containing protein [Spirosoma montaniterrae]AQG81051.1 hypothetical protein AWR27_18030 [Spirosoma montaniterrae]